jgi:hypothetical protein
MGNCHQSKCKQHYDKETRNNNNITISQMPSTRSGEMNYKVGSEQHHGRYARVRGAFASGHEKWKTGRHIVSALCFAHSLFVQTLHRGLQSLFA